MSNIVDVRGLPPVQRHPMIFDAFDSLEPGGEMTLVNDHDPKPLRYQMMHEREGQFDWEYLEEA